MAKRLIGSFGAAVAEAKAEKEAPTEDQLVIEFGPDKTEFYVAHPGWVAFASYFASAAAGHTILTYGGQIALLDLIRAAIVPPPPPEQIPVGWTPTTKDQEWEKFKRISSDNNIQPIEFLDIVRAIQQAYNSPEGEGDEGSVPTTPPDDSSSGRSNTSPSSSPTTSVTTTPLDPEHGADEAPTPSELSRKKPANKKRAGAAATG